MSDDDLSVRQSSRMVIKNQSYYPIQAGTNLILDIEECENEIGIINYTYWPKPSKVLLGTICNNCHNNKFGFEPVLKQNPTIYNLGYKFTWDDVVIIKDLFELSGAKCHRCCCPRDKLEEIQKKYIGYEI